jgi:hypothetical protein
MPASKRLRSLAKTHLHLLVPGLLQPLKLWRKDFAFQPQAENLLRLCANARPETLPVQGLENTLFHLCGHPADTEIPFAYYRYLSDFGVPPEQPLLCADPVALQTGIDQVLMRPELPPLSVPEMETLLVILNKHLAEDGLQLVANHPQRWYLLGERIDASLQTVPLLKALGQSIFPLLPRGERYWHRLLNELQMLLHTSGTPANALWLWGASIPAVLPPLQKEGRGGFIGTSTTAEVMASATQTPHQLATKLADCDFSGGNQVIILEDLLQPAVADDLQGWQDALNGLEENWFAPALAGMKSGKFSVSLSACDGRTLHCQPTPLWKIGRAHV